MYSAVLMLALTAGNEAIDFGRARCNTCTTACSTACTTTVAHGCTSACTARHGLFGNRCHGCTTSCSTSCTTTRVVCSTACSSSCHSSCHGGLFARLRDRGCHCSSSCTVSTCCSTVVVPAKKDMPKVEKIEGPKKEEASVRSATIIVSLPADARLIVDGAATKSTTERRTLVTPALEVGTEYVYTMQAEVTRDGRVVTQNQQVTVRGGQTSNVTFNFPAQTVASR